MEAEAAVVAAKAEAVGTVAGVAAAEAPVVGVAVEVEQGEAMATAGRTCRVVVARELGATARATGAMASGVQCPTPPIRPRRTSERKLPK